MQSIIVQAKSLAAPSSTSTEIISKMEDLKVQAMEKAAHTMSKSFNAKTKNSKFSWLMQKIMEILALEEPPPAQHRFAFENCKKAAKFNSTLIKNTDYDFLKACRKQKGSIVSPGTEFRSIKNLQLLFSHHEDWKEFKSIISNGCDYKLENPVDEETRKSDLKAMIKRGNHKSTSKNKNFKVLEKAFSKEVKLGWSIPVTIKAITKIKNAFVIPLGVANQYSIDETGQRIPKQRVTHDATFPTPSGDSVNNRTIDALLQQCIYGQCLRRVIHAIHRLRLAKPSTKIMMSKYDLDAAYRRLHVRHDQALQCVTIIGDIAYIPLRLPFGVAAGPSIYSTISETIFDLTNDILNDKTWDIDHINSPLQSELEKPFYLDDSLPFETLQPLEVYIPLRHTFCDGYIDDFLSVGLDEADLLRRSQEAPTLAVHSVFRPVHDDEPIHRDDAISAKKLKGEGTPSEQKIMLGWLICTRSCRIYLPKDKELAWLTDIQSLLTSTFVETKELESIIGRCNHIGYILPNARYFLNRLRHLLMRCQRYGKQSLQQWEKEDLELWKKFISHASLEGVSFNNISFTKHNQHILTDASEFGLGGYNPNTGRAWRFQLLPWMHKCMHINILEFIACIIGIWLEILFNKESKQHNFLKVRALTDNSSAVGWLYKSSFNPKSHLQHDIVARKFATLLLENETAITSQHTPGQSNIIADSLSRDFHLPNKQLTFILKSLYPSQVTQNFQILETLPREIISWISSLRATSTKLSAPPSKPERSKTGTLFGGANSLSALVSKINTLKNMGEKTKSKFCQPLQKVYEEMKMAEQADLLSPAAQYHPPSETYVRPFGRTFGATRL